MKIAIIGGGNMGGATAIGLAKAGIKNIVVTARHQATLNKFNEYDIETTTDNLQAVEGADIIFLVVKPWIIEDVVKKNITCIKP